MNPVVRRSMPNVVPILGLWHSYKLTLELVFQRYSRLVFGRLFHAVLPNSKVPKKPKHVFMQSLGLFLMFGWADYAEQFASIACRSDHPQRHHAKNMCILMNFVLPNVRFVVDFGDKWNVY